MFKVNDKIIFPWCGKNIIGTIIKIYPRGVVARVKTESGGRINVSIEKLIKINPNSTAGLFYTA